MTQTSSAIIVAIKPGMEYARLCMSMRLGNARYSATGRRQHGRRPDLWGHCQRV